METLYERDLRPLKVRILESPRHRRTVRVLAEMLGARPAVFIRWAMERLDMQYLENLPSRYEAWHAQADREDPLSRATGATLFSVYIPLLPREAVDRILADAREEMARGGDPEGIAREVQERMRGVLDR